MNGVPLLPLVASLSTLLVGCGLALARLAERDARFTARLRAASGQAARSAGEPGGGASWLQPLRILGELVRRSGMLSRKTIADLEQTLSATAHRPETALPLFLGAKLALMGALPALAWVLLKALAIHLPPLIVLAVAAIAGMLLPDMIIKRIRRRYLRAVERGLPDALDLLIICAEAGLPLEAGLDRVAAEFRATNRPAATELLTTSSEMKILTDRRQALVNMGTRTRLDIMVRLGGTLAQTMQYGTPLTQALRVLSAEMRQMTLTAFEQRAARLPVLLTMPMIVFILPCIMLVIAGPAIVQVLTAFHHR